MPTPPQRPRRNVPLWWAMLAGWLVAYGAWIAVAGSWWVLALAAVFVAGVAATAPRGWAGRLVVVMVALPTGLAAAVEWRLHEVETRWPAMVEAVEERTAEALRRELDGSLDRIEIAVDGAISEVIERPGRGFVDLDPLRRSAGVSAVAVFAPDGRMVSWGGIHRGPLPADHEPGAGPYIFRDGPIFQHLYAVRALPGGWSVIAAILLDSDARVAEGMESVADRFERRHGVRPMFTSPERARGPAVWDWAFDEVILSASFPDLTRAHTRGEVLRQGGRAGAAAWLLVFGIAAALWWRRRRSPRIAPLVFGSICAGLLLAADRSVEVGGVMAAETFPLWIAFAGILAIVAALLARPAADGDGGGRYPLLPAVLAAAVLIPGLVVVSEALLSEAWAGRGSAAIPALLAPVLAIALALYLVWPGARRGRSSGRSVWLWVGMATATALGLAAVAAWSPDRALPSWIAALWAIPYAVCLFGGGTTAGSLRWASAGVIAVSALLPFYWSAGIEARIDAAEREIAALGVDPSPALERTLRQFAEEARVLADDGETGVNLLYRAWAGSGLARSGQAVRLVVLAEDAVQTELRIGDVPMPFDLIAEPLEALDPRATPVRIERYADRMDVHYLLVAALDPERSVVAVIPPRRALHGPEGTTLLLAPGEFGPNALGDARLTLVPDPEPPAPLLRRDTAGERPVLWQRTATGWRSEALVDYPEGTMHAHLDLRTGAMPVVLARAGLRVVLAVLGVLLVWGIATVLAGRGRNLLGRGLGWGRTFRGRLTLTLLLFFILPTVVLGYVAFEGLSREVFRGATERASWVLDQGARAIGAERLPTLASRLNAELLVYRGAILEDAGSPEAMDLGLYPSWLSPTVWREIGSGERLTVMERRVLAGREVLMVYRRTAPGEVLAVPTPVAAAEIEQRRAEFAEVILFALLLGGVLSAILAVLVGRGLSRPIDEVTAAAVQVGEGDFRVQLAGDRPDEFGTLNTAFNRMVGRLRHARSALLREKRRTEAIVRDTATGVVALDPRGRVALVNPAARRLLGEGLERGEPLSASGSPVFPEIESLVSSARTAPDGEADAEIESGGRILRAQARRLRRKRRQSGFVVTVEDITAEIRTARILAWGEMAQQVAHEIKNPLTPIKLAVQHVRRAFRDGRPDYDEILERNVEAILKEIDRLGRIARGFARFGTPPEPGLPVEPTPVASLSREVVDLYRRGDDRVSYRVEFEDGDMLALAREDEYREVLINLLENAREAVLAEGGAVEVRGGPGKDGRVEIEVHDTGEGVDPEFFEKVFEPHFSTRTSGTGLGLAIVRRIVDSWGGDVWMRSAAGRGTTVTLSLRTGPEPGTEETDPDT